MIILPSYFYFHELGLYIITPYYVPPQVPTVGTWGRWNMTIKGLKNR